MGVWYRCTCGVAVSLDSCEEDTHREACPHAQPISPEELGTLWLAFLVALVLACYMWGTS